MSFEKENFLRTKLITCLQRIHPATPSKWGKMNLQQMIEHYSVDGIMVASGRIKFDKIFTPPDKLIRLREFLLSEKPFKENTHNPLLGIEPAPLHFKTVQAAIGALQIELIYFFEVFENKPARTTLNPIFGELNFDENVQLLHKHALHHLRQFGVIV